MLLSQTVLSNDKNITSLLVQCINCNGKNTILECGCGCSEPIVAFNFDSWVWRKYKSGHYSRVKPTKGHLNAQWKGGRVVDKKGYILIYMPSHHFKNRKNRIREHRYVYELYNKCSLLPWGDCHHLNGIKSDNRPENLYAFMHGRHSQVTNTEDLSRRQCIRCGSKKTSLQGINKDRPMWYIKPNGFICHSCHGREVYSKKVKGVIIR